jgi:hypothetical protein
VAWTAVSITVSDVFDSAEAYGVASGILFLIVIGGGYLILRRMGMVDEATDELIDDPVITGERRGIGNAALNLVGGLLAVPFILYEYIIKSLDSLSTIGDVPELAPEEEQPSTPSATAEEAGGD